MAVLAQSFQVVHSIAARGSDVMDFQVLCESTFETLVFVSFQDFRSDFPPFGFLATGGSIPSPFVWVFRLPCRDEVADIAQVGILALLSSVDAVLDVAKKDQIGSFSRSPVLASTLANVVHCQYLALSQTLVTFAEPCQHSLTDPPVQFASYL